jgi:hypothetical protein
MTVIFGDFRKDDWPCNPPPPDHIPDVAGYFHDILRDMPDATAAEVLIDVAFQRLEAGDMRRIVKALGDFVSYEEKNDE